MAHVIAEIASALGADSVITGRNQYTHKSMVARFYPCIFSIDLYLPVGIVILHLADAVIRALHHAVGADGAAIVGIALDHTLSDR